MHDELHLASILVHARPEATDDVAAVIGTMGWEVHLRNASGKIVATHEAGSAGELGDALTRVQLLDGVLAATMVFHHCEAAEPRIDAREQIEQAREVPP
jgi:nitrate reductase NapD